MADTTQTNTLPVIGPGMTIRIRLAYLVIAIASLIAAGVWAYSVDRGLARANSLLRIIVRAEIASGKIPPEAITELMEAIRQ